MCLRHRVALSFMLCSLFLGAQQKITSPLTIDWIMQGPSLYGNTPQNIFWSPDGSKLYFSWKPSSADIDDPMEIFSVDRSGKNVRRLSKEELRDLPPARGSKSPDGRWIAFSDKGDIYLHNIKTKTNVALTSTTEPESSPVFGNKGSDVYFVRSNNLFSVNLDTGQILQHTDIRSTGSDTQSFSTPGRGGRGSLGDQADRGTDSQEWVKQEERVLFETIRRRTDRRMKDDQTRREEQTRKPFVLPPTASVASIRPTPDGRYIILNLNFPAAKAINTIVPSYVTEKGYVENIPSRSLVGDQQSTSQWIRIDSKTGEAKPFQMMLEEGKESKRSIRLSELSWNEEGTRAIAYARATDNKDEWILAMDLDMAQGRILYSHQDKAWIGGPGAFVFGWINNEEIYFESEASGWAHLYRMSYRGGKPVALTSGSWEVQSVTLMPNKKDFLLVTNEKHHGEKQVYLLSVNGGERRPLSNTTGFHEPYISPDGKTMADLASSANRPPEIFIKQLNTNKLPIQITKSISNDFESRPWIIPPVLTFTARDGAQVPARLYKPTQWKAGGPAVLFIHGAGYLQNAHKGWSTYPREYMFHHFLMEQGYLVLDIDYRGSSGYGRDWRTAISTFMGGKDLDDAVDAARWMTSEFQVDPKRIGIYGGSYGGFITLMAMFTKPDVFNAGAALRPVTDWAHYNHGYTSNILGEPQKESEAYRRSSPIYHAQGLQGALLICHGVIDTNVHFQDSVRLAQKLIELRKENWELALYPAEDHGFREATSWADEFKRIFKLFENNLK